MAFGFWTERQQGVKQKICSTKGSTIRKVHTKKQHQNGNGWKETDSLSLSTGERIRRKVRKLNVRFKMNI